MLIFHGFTFVGNGGWSIIGGLEKEEENLKSGRCWALV
jgi:hypothetical protein